MKSEKKCPNCNSINTRSNGSQGKEVYGGTHCYETIWYECKDCKTNGRSPYNFPEKHKRKPKPKVEYNNFDILIAHKLFHDVVQTTKYKKTVSVNKLTNTVMTAYHIAKILGINYKVINEWVHNPMPQIEYSEQAFKEYIKTTKNSVLILNLLGYIKTPIDLSFIPYFLTKKARKSKITGHYIYPDEWELHREKEGCKYWLRGLLTNEVCVDDFTCREDAIVVLGAILRCQYSDLLKTTYKDFLKEKKSIKFQRKTYVLRRNAKDIAKWLKDRAINENENLCVDDKGQFIYEDKIDEHLASLCSQLNIDPIRFRDFIKGETAPTDS